MSSGSERKGRNWYSAMGILFIVSGLIVIVRDAILWNEFVFDFLLDSEINSAKISFGMLGFGSFLLVFGVRRKIVQ
ncbi:MAG: hypothetical protein QXG67_02045 [Candidatus Nitrosotenuis sp.]